MNNLFLPNEQEEKLIEIIHKYIRNEFALIRITETMLKKSIMDSSFEVREVLKLYGIADYSNISQGDKVLRSCTILSSKGISEENVSYYRPRTKKGDPRFWVYALKKYLEVGNLVYFTAYGDKLLVIPLNTDPQSFETVLAQLFPITVEANDFNILKGLITKIREIKDRGWILSVSPSKRNPKDMGDTFERELGIKPNSLISPDYEGKIEIKTKDSEATTKDTLFSCVPNWSISTIETSAEMILKYGYPTNQPEKYPDFIDLYVTVTNKPNNQGLFLEVDYDSELLNQFYIKESQTPAETCAWDFELLKNKLYTKHPKTAWIIGESCTVDGNIYFRYTSLSLSEQPIFSQFLLLLDQGKITYDWRGRIKVDGTAYKDKGHAFRIAPKSKTNLFGNFKEISFE